MRLTNDVFSRLDRTSRRYSSPDFNKDVLQVLGEVVSQLRDESLIEANAQIDVDGCFLRFDERDSHAMMFVAFLVDKRPIVFRLVNWTVECWIADNVDALEGLLRKNRFSDLAIEVIVQFVRDPKPALDVILCFDHPRPLDSLKQILCAAVVAKEDSEVRYHAYVDYNRVFFEPDEIFKSLGIELDVEKEPDFGKYHVVRRIYRNFRRDDRQYFPKMFGERQSKPSHIFISLEAEKRVWKEQEEGLAGFLNAVREKVGEPLRVLVNGMTASYNGYVPASFKDIDEREVEIIEQLKKLGPADTVFERVFGETVQAKIEAARSCSFYAGPLGTAAMVASLLGMPGITFHNTHFIKAVRAIDPQGSRRIDPDHIENLPDQLGVAPKFDELQTISYSIDPEYFIETARTQFVRTVLSPQARKASAKQPAAN